MKIGVLGAGHLGKIHLKCIGQIPQYELTGFYDPDEKNSEQVKKEFGIHRFNSIEELVDAVDCVDIVTPTVSHFDCAQKALKKFKHVFIEKPLTTSVNEAKKLIDLSIEAGVKVQVGHVERFNPAFLAGKKFCNNPLFIETHRLAQFNPRGTDVPVILDLMIHDIDIILNIVQSNIQRISASGVAVVSDTPDIANARLEFDNGCVVNLTASRISLKNMRKARIFQRDAYLAIDFLKKEVELVKLEDVSDEPGPLDMVFELPGKKKMKKINIEKPQVEQTNAIKMELETFYESITKNTDPPVTIHDGYNSLKVAYEIMYKLNNARVL